MMHLGAVAHVADYVLRLMLAAGPIAISYAIFRQTRTQATFTSASEHQKLRLALLDRRLVVYRKIRSEAVLCLDNDTSLTGLSDAIEEAQLVFNGDMRRQIENTYAEVAQAAKQLSSLRNELTRALSAEMIEDAARGTANMMEPIHRHALQQIPDLLSQMREAMLVEEVTPPSWQVDNQ